MDEREIFTRKVGMGVTGSDMCVCQLQGLEHYAVCWLSYNVDVGKTMTCGTYIGTASIFENDFGSNRGLGFVFKVLIGLGCWVQEPFLYSFRYVQPTASR